MKNETFITSGTYKGRKLRTPGAGTHPMGAREKLALFNMISGYLPGATVLDVYAGSGALGIETLSRGASQATFLDKDPGAVRIIRENLKNLGLEADVRQQDVLRPTDLANWKFDIVIADPPYDKYTPEMITNLVKFVTINHVLVVSTPEIPPEIPNMILIKTRKYAKAHISIYQPIDLASQK